MLEEKTMAEKITIVLPDGRRIKRVMQQRLTPYVICNKIPFTIDYYDLNDINNGLYRLAYCYINDIAKAGFSHQIYTDRPKVDKRSCLIGVAGSAYDHEYNNIITEAFINKIR